ncbi:gamma-glutamyl hydrolase-like [Sinocyclocheilus rhinocerous]|uniref:gamma-glutamyl hydrolase-like n=1 Tax=Sinocyclocheilus rhinocerous TaxID=307959 RepID=UPI0007B8E5D1|nr:PREDICTED: gamma-glutamyl hydrolase-like [Sinocyclocheilus rhinocerous]
MGFSALLCAGVVVLCSAAPFKLPQRNEPHNDRPIIGILTQEVDNESMKKFGKTYIPSSYVKYIESGGARVVPIRLNQSLAEHEQIFRSINGIGDDCKASSSRMFTNFPSDVRKALSQEPLTGNFHHYGVTKAAFMGNEKLSGFFSVLSTNIAQNGLEFVSTVEGRKHPFYGVQWHPEVNRFQWDPRYNFPHSSNAVRVSSLLAEFFVNEGRRSSHHFSEAAEESSALIYNYNPVHVANISAYEQSYFF